MVGRMISHFFRAQDAALFVGLFPRGLQPEPSQVRNKAFSCSAYRCTADQFRDNRNLESFQLVKQIYNAFQAGGKFMPRGPKGEKRPAGAIIVGWIATGAIGDQTTDDGKNAAAVALGAWAGRRGPPVRGAMLDISAPTNNLGQAVGHDDVSSELGETSV